VKNFIFVLLLVLVPTFVAAQQQKPAWAFPTTDKVLPPSSEDPNKVWTAAGSSLSVTREQINDRYNTPNWFPEMYPPMPGIVQFGNRDTEVRACGLCHLPTGTGHDESAYVAGLPVDYFLRQMADYKNGNRKGSGTMIRIAKAITDEEVRSAAEYFASVTPRPWIRVVETDTVPKSYVARGNKRLLHPDGGTEPIGNRIIEVPEDEDIVLNRDPRSGFVAYVPKGSIDRGRELATTGGGGKTVNCAICHGEKLQGLGDVPAIAGRHPNYIVRQLWTIQNGERVGNSNILMKLVVDKLSVDDMLAIAAYTASLSP
jgi:cytochrome c553